MSDPDLPLAGVRVLDLTRLLPGAYATLLLADLGADVVKVEHPRGGDPARAMPPFANGTSVYFEVVNRNKRSMTLDLRVPDTVPVIDALAPQFDILVESFRPRTARRLGVDAATLRGRHPRLIHASITGFGRTGPYADRAAHDINYEAIAGLLRVSRAADREPETPPLLIADVGAGMNVAAGILAALYRREKTGVGMAVDVSIHEAALWWLMIPAARLLAGRGERGADDLPIGGNHACYNVYRTADDQYVALGALESKFWTLFCGRIGRPDLIPLHTKAGDAQARALADVGAVMRSRTRAEWLAIFSDVDACLWTVNTVREALEDPHVEARAAIGACGGNRYVMAPITTSDRGTPAEERPPRVDVRRAPRLGEHTDEVLESAGIDRAARDRLRARGLI